MSAVAVADGVTLARVVLVMLVLTEVVGLVDVLTDADGVIMLDGVRVEESVSVLDWETDVVEVADADGGRFILQTYGNKAAGDTSFNP